MLSLQMIKFLNYFISTSIAYLIGSMVSRYFQALIADKLGDDTGKKLGFLSLNPFVYVDVLGFLFFLFFSVGWVPAIPINPQNFKHKYKRLKLAFANFSGTIGNLFCAVFALFIMVIFFGGLYLNLPMPSFFARYASLTTSFKLLLTSMVRLGIGSTVLGFFTSTVRMVMFSFAKKAVFVRSQRYIITQLIVVMLAVLFLIEPLRVLVQIGIIGIEGLLWTTWSSLLTLVGLISWYA